MREPKVKFPIVVHVPELPEPYSWRMKWAGTGKVYRLLLQRPWFKRWPEFKYTVASTLTSTYNADAPMRDGKALLERTEASVRMYRMDFDRMIDSDDLNG